MAFNSGSGVRLGTAVGASGIAPEKTPLLAATYSTLLAAVSWAASAKTAPVGPAIFTVCQLLSTS